jgi:iron(III) transport system ATP-binding protein
MLEVDSISFCAGERTLLSQVSLRLGAGESLALLGPSGSGKTTLLRVIMGFDAPEDGSVAWQGRTLSSANRIAVPTEQRQFGMVFQEAALFPHLDVSENVAFGLNRLPADERRARTREWLARMRLEPLKRRPVQALSGGERQRVALARALAARPNLLLLDEPFSNLDRLVRGELLDELRTALAETGTASILVTHDVRDAVDFGANMLLLSAGRVHCQGRLADILETGGDEWAQRFISTGLGQADHATATT